MQEYPATLSAVASAELSLWPVVEAVVAEIASTEKGGAQHGQYERCAAYLADNGFQTWSKDRLRRFREVGVWIESGCQAPVFRSYPFEWVIEAKKVARGDHEKALGILSEATSKRDIRPDRVSTETMSEEVAAETVARIAKKHPKAVARAARSKPVAKAVATDPEAALRVKAASAREKEKRKAAKTAIEKAGEAVLDQDAQDGFILMRLSHLGYEVRRAVNAYARGWEAEKNDLSPEAQEVALDRVAGDHIAVGKVFAAIEGKNDLDAVLAEILSDTPQEKEDA